MNYDYDRQLTRIQRIEAKKENAIQLPVSLTCINFDHDVNTALILRTAACFGAEEVLIIGKVPERRYLKQLGGSVVDFVNIRAFSNPQQYLKYIRDNNIRLVAAELYENSQSLYNFAFDARKTSIVCGHETNGIPLDILLNSEIIHIPCRGIGFSLNVATCATAIMSEYCRQYYTLHGSELAIQNPN